MVYILQDSCFTSRVKETRTPVRLDAMDQIELLQKVVDAFTRKHGRAPASFAELARAGFERGNVADPDGLPYRLDGFMVSLDPSSKLLPLPWEGQKLQ